LDLHRFSDIQRKIVSHPSDLFKQTISA